MSIFDNENQIEISNEDINKASLVCVDIEPKDKKRAFANVLGAELGLKLLQKLDIKANNLVSMHTIPAVLKDIDLSDITTEKNIKLDIRIVQDENHLFIPKSHFEYDITPDIYVFFKLSKDTTSAEFIGAIAPDEIDKSIENGEYYFITANTLYNLNSLKSVLNNGKSDNYDIVEEIDLAKAQSMLLDFIDGELIKTDKKFLYNILKRSNVFKSELKDFQRFETISTYLANSEEVLEDSSLGIIGAEDVHENRFFEGNTRNIDLDELAEQTAADFLEEFLEQNKDSNMSENENIIDGEYKELPPEDTTPVEEPGELEVIPADEDLANLSFEQNFELTNNFTDLTEPSEGTLAPLQENTLQEFSFDNNFETVSDNISSFENISEYSYSPEMNFQEQQEDFVLDLDKIQNQDLTPLADKYEDVQQEYFNENTINNSDNGFTELSETQDNIEDIGMTLPQNENAAQYNENIEEFQPDTINETTSANTYEGMTELYEEPNDIENVSMTSPESNETLYSDGNFEEVPLEPINENFAEYSNSDTNFSEAPEEITPIDMDTTQNNEMMAMDGNFEEVAPTSFEVQNEDYNSNFVEQPQVYENSDVLSETFQDNNLTQDIDLTLQNFEQDNNSQLLNFEQPEETSSAEDLTIEPAQTNGDFSFMDSKPTSNEVVSEKTEKKNKHKSMFDGYEGELSDNNMSPDELYKAYLENEQKNSDYNENDIPSPELFTHEAYSKALNRREMSAASTPIILEKMHAEEELKLQEQVENVIPTEENNGLEEFTMDMAAAIEEANPNIHLSQIPSDTSEQTTTNDVSPTEYFDNTSLNIVEDQNLVSLGGQINLDTNNEALNDVNLDDLDDDDDAIGLSNIDTDDIQKEFDDAMSSGNIDIDKIDIDNLDIDNIDIDNLDIDNIDIDSLASGDNSPKLENKTAENLILENTENIIPENAENLIPENADSITPDYSDNNMQDEIESLAMESGLSFYDDTQSTSNTEEMTNQDNQMSDLLLNDIPDITDDMANTSTDIGSDFVDDSTQTENLYTSDLEQNDQNTLEQLYDDNDFGSNNEDVMDQSFEQNNVEINLPQENEKQTKKKSSMPLLLVLGVVVLCAYGYMNKDFLMDKINEFIPNKKPKIAQNPNMPIEGETEPEIVPEMGENTEKPEEADEAEEQENKKPIGEIPGEAGGPQDAKSMEESLSQKAELNEETQTFTRAPQPLTTKTIKRFYWEIPQDLTYNSAIVNYLKNAGKTAKFAIQSDLLNTTEFPYSNKMIVHVVVTQEGSPDETNISVSSGSKQIDELVLQSVKAALRYVKAPTSEFTQESYEFSLIINF